MAQVFCLMGGPCLFSRDKVHGMFIASTEKADKIAEWRMRDPARAELIRSICSSYWKKIKCATSLVKIRRSRMATIFSRDFLWWASADHFFKIQNATPARWLNAEIGDCMAWYCLKRRCQLLKKQPPYSPEIQLSVRRNTWAKVYFRSCRMTVNIMDFRRLFMRPSASGGDPSFAVICRFIFLVVFMARNVGALCREL